MFISFDSTTAVSADYFLHFDTDELQVNKRELVEFQKGQLFQGDMVATEQMCGLVCKRHDWCKTFNHHALGKVCQLIMTDFRLLNTTQDDQSTPLTTGWRHFSPKYFVRGSGSKPIDQSIRLWVNETQTNDNSISVQWSAAEQGDFSSFVITGQQLDITNVDHPSQTGLIAADLISHYPNAQTRTFTSIGHMIPGVKYNFELNSFYNGAIAQMPLYTSESTFPSFVVENPSLRVITSHTIDIHWTFNGSAQEMDIWHSPITGACPCNLPAIGTLTHQIHSLIAGEEYYLSTQLTSKYGKKGPIRTIIQSTYTDDVIFDDTTTTLTSLDLLVQIESGVGNQMWVDMTPELGGVTGELYKDFNLLTEFKFVNLEPGDLYKLNLTVESRGERPLYRSFQFQDSTFPEEPVLTPESIVPTEHTLEFTWTVPYFFNNVLVWNDPADGNCPCPFNNDSPKTGTISDLEAGEEYTFYAQSESDYGKTSTTMSFTHSLYTDVITHVDISSTINTITFEPHFESGVGAEISVEVRGVDYYHSDVLNQPFHPKTGTISDLEAGEEYTFYAQSESDYGKTSTTMSFTHSLYTDVITHVDISSTINTITFEPHFESGVGAEISVEVRGVDYYHSDVLNQPFQLEPVFELENLMPGSKYEWEMSVTSRGSNPLLRHYSYLGYTYPEQPLGVKDALALMLEHDVFQLTVGPTPLNGATMPQITRKPDCVGLLDNVKTSLCECYYLRK
ncbi:uncharacterized protein LOC142334849 [Convolutriloba macropyga]|uniref:uncharacterized protein LOC142334849 n=1 Tax=Convolutriloba macropyga TaxID=536237 RepID=UPI003F5278F2